jgi:hypothetical protein
LRIRTKFATEQHDLFSIPGHANSMDKSGSRIESNITRRFPGYDVHPWQPSGARGVTEQLN